MSVQEIKEKLATLPRKEQDEVVAFLFHLRHAEDADYQRDMARRLQDKESAHWLSPDEFERELDKKASRQIEAYAVYLHVDLLEGVPARGEQRRLIMSFVRALAQNPYTPGDFTDQDASLRTRQVKIIGRYAITYWVDDPVKAVMVVSVRPADS